MLLILEMLREKDEQIARLQEDRVRLSGQVGYLQAQVQERDARLRLVEAAAIESGARRLLPQAVDTHAPDADVPGSSAPDDRVPASEGSAKVPAASNGQEYNETVTALSATPSTGPEASAQPGLHAESGVAVPPDRSGEAVGLEPATTHAADTSSVQEGPQPDAAATTPGDASADLGNKNLAETALGQDRSTRTRTEMPQPAAGPAKPVEPGDRETAGDGAVIARAGGAQTPEAELDPSRVTAGPRHPMTPRPLLAWPNENKRSAEAAGSAHTAARTPRKRDTLQSQARAGVERLRRFFQRER
jgi:hypothetical protein